MTVVVSQELADVSGTLVVAEGNRSALNSCPWLFRHPVLVSAPSRKSLFVKRAIDLGAVLAASPILLVMAAGVALALKIESPRDPVLFRQHRTGLKGNRFSLFKFRSMVTNAEEMKAQLAHLNQRQWPDFKIDRDPRITRVGRVLRKLSLDEIPQFWNVLKGDMSLVGPRPTSFRAENLEWWQNERFVAKPGLTGLWQIGGRDTTSIQDRMRLDVAYVTRRSLLLDLEIALRTIPVVALGRGSV